MAHVCLSGMHVSQIEQKAALTQTLPTCCAAASVMLEAICNCSSYLQAHSQATDGRDHEHQAHTDRQLAKLARRGIL
jgi:hypothetical protein